MIHKARKTALRLHNNQYRKSGHLPYFSHLENVANIVAEYTIDQELIAAAYLHDTIEDTPYTAKDLKQGFGERVASIVQAVTKDKSNHTAYLTQIDNQDAALIAGADKLDNSKDLQKVVDWSVFNFAPAEKVAQYTVVSYMVRKYYPDLADQIRQALSLVKPKINHP